MYDYLCRPTGRGLSAASALPNQLKIRAKDNERGIGASVPYLKLLLLTLTVTLSGVAFAIAPTPAATSWWSNAFGSTLANPKCVSASPDAAMARCAIEIANSLPAGTPTLSNCQPKFNTPIHYTASCFYIPNSNYLENADLIAIVSNTCPANSTLFGGTCICTAPHVENSAANACVIVATPPPESCAPCQDGTAVGDPIIPATGEETLTQSDHEADGPNGLSLVRSYRSSRIVGTITGPASAGLGQPWSHNHSVFLVQAGPANTASSKVRVMLGDGNVRAFDWDTVSSIFKPTNGVDTLTSNALGPLYRRSDDDTVWQFDAIGKLLTITQKNGWITSYHNNAIGLPNRVTNHFGRSLKFAYNAANQLTSVTASDGRVSSYGYDGTGRLISATYPGTVSGTTVSKTYLYENASFPQLLTGITDETGSRYATISYDAQGRGISSQLGAGADLHAISYGTNTATVTDPLGTQRTYNYGMAKGKLAVLAADKPSAKGVGDAASRVMDANGLITQETDFLGVITTNTWDIDRRLLLSSTKAAGRPEAQTTTTQWHPTLRLPVLVTSPGRSTAYTYDAAGNKLSEAVTDTTTNQTRTTTWTYNGQGQPITVTPPIAAQASAYAYFSDTSFSGQPAGLLDPYFDAVTFLLHGDGTDGSTVVTDSSAAPKSVVAVGNARISTAQSKFGGASMYFDGAGDYLSVAPSAQWNFGQSDFTVEAWVNNAVRPTSGGWQQIVGNVQAGYGGWRVLLGTAGELHLSWFNPTGVAVGVSTPANVLPVGQWAHVAVSTGGRTTRIFVNGISVAVFGNGGVFASNSPLYVGTTDTGAWFWNGYIDDLRITKGIARYTANFTPPTQALPHVGEVLDPAAVGHRAGDLQSVTNAAGHVTQFNQYDQAGRVRKMTDAKGVVTDTTYTPRGWIASTTVTPPGGVARTTTYTYDNVGQLTGVALPDATNLSYSYDAAHRLVGVTDAKGNSVTYTLDNMGNRVNEQVKDAQGSLQRNITRVYDALNRVQQVTGAAN